MRTFVSGCACTHSVRSTSFGQSLFHFEPQTTARPFAPGLQHRSFPYIVRSPRAIYRAFCGDTKRPACSRCSNSSLARVTAQITNSYRKKVQAVGAARGMRKYALTHHRHTRGQRLRKTARFLALPRRFRGNLASMCFRLTCRHYVNSMR